MQASESIPSVNELNQIKGIKAASSCVYVNI
jgi:hypothetical protein